MMNEPKTTPNARRVFLRFPKWFGDFKVDDKDIEAGEGEETCDRVTSVRRGFRKVRSFIKTPTDEVSQPGAGHLFSHLYQTKLLHA